MKITRRQLRRIIQETMHDTLSPGWSGIPAFDPSVWVPFIESYGGSADDLDEIAQYLGAPDRSWLHATPDLHDQTKLYAAIKDVILPKLERVIRESNKYESQLLELLEAGHFDQAIALADSLGISGRQLPWTGELLEDYVHEKIRHIPMQDTEAAHQAKIDALDVLDISLDEYMGPSALMMHYNSMRW